MDPETLAKYQDPTVVGTPADSMGTTYHGLATAVRMGPTETSACVTSL